MSRSTWAVFLAAVFTISGAQYFDSPSKVEGAESEALRGSMIAYCQGLVKQVYSTTNNAISIKLQDLPVGKVIQVGELKFVKVSNDQYLSISPGCVDPVLTSTGAQKLLTYTGNYQSYTFYAGCEYQIELWGASGGLDYHSSGTRGLGAYTSGRIFIPSTQQMYLYCGQEGIKAQYASKGNYSRASWNGGGRGVGSDDSDDGAGSGGGATDLRLVNGDWNNATSLNSRIMVAGGGAGVGISQISGYAGGLSNGGTYRTWSGSTTTDINVANQTSGYAFGVGEDAATNKGWCEGPAGGGGGYWGGRTNTTTGCRVYGAGSGSSYISGHTGCVAIKSATDRTPLSGCSTGSTNNTCSIHYSKLVFTDTVMIDSQGYYWTTSRQTTKAMPNPTGGNYASGVGHTGNGYARITRLN